MKTLSNRFSTDLAKGARVWFPKQCSDPFHMGFFGGPKNTEDLVHRRLAGLPTFIDRPPGRGLDTKDVSDVHVMCKMRNT